MRAILAIGANSSGSSCVGGVLNIMGINMGQVLHGYYECGIFKNLLEKKVNRIEFVKEYIRSRIASNNIVWGIKHPSMSDDLWAKKVIDCIKEELGEYDDIKIIFCDRDTTDCIRSACARWPRGDPLRKWTQHTIRSMVGKELIFQEYKNEISFLRVKYEDIINSYLIESIVLEIWEFCTEGLNIDFDEELFEKAVNFIDPKMKHW